MLVLIPSLDRENKSASGVVRNKTVRKDFNKIPQYSLSQEGHLVMNKCSCPLIVVIVGGTFLDGSMKCKVQKKKVPELGVPKVIGKNKPKNLFQSCHFDLKIHVHQTTKQIQTANVYCFFS